MFYRYSVSRLAIYELSIMLEKLYCWINWKKRYVPLLALYWSLKGHSACSLCYLS